MKRHWFVSLTLWASLIQCIIWGLIAIFEIHFVFSLLVIPAIISCILLLNWKIIGFYTYCISYFLNIFVSLLFGEGIVFSILLFIINVIFLYGILSFKREGISAWDYLNNNTLKVSEENINKKCSSCNMIYLKLMSVCPGCGSSMYTIIEKQEQNENTLNNNSADNKKCKKCNTILSSDIFKCPKCGNESFV